MTRAATSASSASRPAGSRDGYSKRSKLFVPGYLTESVTPIVVTRPRREKPSSVTSSPLRTSSAMYPRTASPSSPASAAIAAYPAR